MHRNTGDKNWYQVKGFSGVWSKDPWIASAMIGNQGVVRGYRVDGAQQAHDFATYAARNDPVRRATVQTQWSPQPQPLALCIWEDDGGKANLSAAAHRPKP